MVERISTFVTWTASQCLTQSYWGFLEYGTKLRPGISILSENVTFFLSTLTTSAKKRTTKLRLQYLKNVSSKVYHIENS